MHNINDVTVKFFTFLYKTNRFHVAVSVQLQVTGDFKMW